MKNDNLSILVLSCDKYSDLWEPFFECFFRYWPDCKFPIYLGSNNKIFDNQSVKTILSGDDKDWSSSLLNILEQINSEYVFIFLEDFFLVDNVDNLKFDDLFNILVENDFNHCHIGLNPKTNSFIESGIGIYEKGMPYRTNVFGLWKKSYLKNIIIRGENPWNFEIMGSYRSSYDDGFYCIPNGIFKTMNMVEKGKWFPSNIKFIKNLGICIDENRREKLSGFYFFKSKIQIIFVKLVTLIPYRNRVKLMNIIRKILFSY